MSSPDKDILPMDAQPFVRTFSYREVLSACMVSLMVLTSTYSLRYLEVEVHGALIGIGVLVAVLLLHILYRLEHKRSNNFVGRMMHDSLYLILLILFRMLIGWYSTGELSFDLDNPLVALFLAWIMLMVLEGLVALLMRFFNFLQWRIL